MGQIHGLLARRGLRAGFGRTALIVVVIGLMGGVGLFAVAGGRRASTAFDRFVAWSRPAHVETGGYGGEVPIGERLDEVAALPAVADASRMETVAALGVEVAPGRVLGGARMSVLGVADDRLLRNFGRIRALEGSLPSPSSTTEGVVDFSTADNLDLDVGDTVTVLAGEEGRHAFPIEIAAVISYPNAFPTVAGWQFNALVLMPGFVQAHPDLLDPWEASLSIRLHGGPGAVNELRQQIADIGMSDIDLPTGIDSVRAGVNKVTRLEAIGLWAAAAVAAAVGAVVAYQMLRRAAASTSSSAAAMAAVGIRRRDLLWAGLLRGAALGAVAAVLAAVVALVASPLAPVGLARRAEIDRGFHADLAVLAAGVPAIIALTATGTAVATAMAFAPRRQVRSLRGRALTQAGPVVATGVLLATRPGRDGRRDHTTVLVGAALTAAACVAVPIVAFGLDGVTRSPDRSGGVWDAFATVDDPAMADELETHLRSVPEVDAVSAGGWIPLTSGDEFVFATVLEPGQGIEPAVSRGRAPRTATEVALGGAAMERLGVDLGDTVELTSSESEQPESFDLDVVGEVIVSSTLFQSYEPDDGVVLAFPFIRDLVGEVGWPYLVTFDEGVDPESGLDAIMATAPEGVLDFGFARNERGDLFALQTMGTIAAWLGAVLLALLLLSMAHLLLASTRLHRSQLAVLRAMGMTGRQIRGAGAVHGAVLASAIVVLGLLLGAPAGSVAWRAMADSLIVLPSLDWRPGVLAIGIACIVTGVVVLGLVVTATVARRSPANVLHVE